jgi:hypothetical protein
VLLDVGNNDILDSGVGSIGSVAMGVWCKLVFLVGGRGGVVPAALVGFAVVLVASSCALAPSSKASSYTPVKWGSSSVITVAPHGGIWFGFSVAVAIYFNRCCSSNRFRSVRDSRVANLCGSSSASLLIGFDFWKQAWKYSSSRYVVEFQ